MSEVIAAVIPVWNEAGAIGPAVRMLPADVRPVIVVDGGSTDGTQAEAAAAGAIVLAQSQRGYGAACAEGAAHAAALGATILVFMDGDGADAGERAHEMAGPIAAGAADFVIATRTPRQAGSMLWHQVLAGRWIGRAVGWATGTRYADMCAYRALRPATLQDLGMRQMGFGWNLEMQMRAAAGGLRIVQLDMPYRCRVAGRSKVAGNLRGTVHASWRIVATLVGIARELRGRGRAVRG